MPSTTNSANLPKEEDFFAAKHPKLAQLSAQTPDSLMSSTAASTPGFESEVASDAPSTPLGDSDNDQLAQSIATSTVTTTVSSSSGTAGVKLAPSTVEITHIGAKGISHRVGKDGQVHLKPVPAATSKSRKKMRSVVSFKPRRSHFDRFNESSSKDQFRGFFTLFWVCLALFVLNTSYTSFASTGQVLSLTFATLFSKDAWILALSDGILIGSLFLCVPFAKVCRRGWIKYYPTAMIFQHLWQAALLGLVIKWARYREWPWVQSGFFVLHTLSMMMKIHSYMSVNGNMADTYHKMKRVQGMLEERVAEVQGSQAGKGQEQLEAAWSKAVKVARQSAGYKDSASMQKKLADWSSLQNQRGSSKTRLLKSQSIVGSPTSSLEADANNQEAEPQKEGKLSTRDHIQLHKDLQEKETADRKAQAEEKDSASQHHKRRSSDVDSKGKREAQLAAHQIRDPHPLSSHPDALVSDLAREIEVMREELLSARPSMEDATSDLVPQDPVMYPYNISYYNFWDYLLVPTLVYELSYPRTTVIRPLYVLEKTLATFGTFFVIYIITEHWIIPFTPTSSTPLIRTFLQLAVPMMLNYLLIFYIMFECICNGFAELTRFADREFYLDWWNARSMDEFSRKWNKPVHSFLLKHVYASTIAAWGLSRGLAMFLTFLLSSLVHELVMAIVSGKVRGYLFAAQMIQLPLIFLSQIPVIRKNETLGNLIFWIGLMCGFPLLNIGYLVY